MVKDIWPWMLIIIPLSAVASDITYMDRPENATVNLSGSVTFRCSFNSSKAKNCTWKRNDNVLMIGGRISLIGKNGPNDRITDCSLRLTEVQNSDEGKYQCSIMVTSSNKSLDYLLNATAWLNIEAVANDITFMVRPENATVNLSGSVTFRCSFISSKAKNCTWKRNDNVLKIGGRISLIGKNGPNDRITNCSLRLTEVQNLDEGKYQCSIVVTSSNKSLDYTDNATAWLNIEEDSNNLQSVEKTNTILYSVIGGSAALIISLSLGFSHLWLRLKKSRKEARIVSQMICNDNSSLKRNNYCPNPPVSPIYENSEKYQQPKIAQSHFFVTTEPRKGDDANSEVLYAQVLVSKMSNIRFPSDYEGTEYATVCLKKDYKTEI